MNKTRGWCLLALVACCALSLAAALPLKLVQQKDGPFSPCSICEDIVGLIDSRIESNATETAIENEVKELCNDMESTPLKVFVRECLALANNVPQFVDALVDRELAPRQVCEEVGICSNTTVRFPSPVRTGGRGK